MGAQLHGEEFQSRVLLRHGCEPLDGEGPRGLRTRRRSGRLLQGVLRAENRDWSDAVTRTPGRLIRALCEIREPSCLSQRALSMVSERADALRRSLATRAASTRLSGGRQGPAGLHTRLVLGPALLAFAVFAPTSCAI